MPLLKKLQIGLGLTFILAIACVTNAAAQTQGVADSSKPVVATNPESNPKKSEVVTPSISTSENSSDPLSAKSRDADGSKKDAVVKDAVVKDAVVKDAVVKGPTAPTAPSQTTPEDKWNFVFSPYFWMAGLHGTAGVGNRTTQVEESFSDIFHSLKFALMGTFEARKNNIVVLTDLEYVSIEDDRATPGPLFSNATARFKTFIFDPEVGYSVWNNSERGASLDVLGGVRVWHVSSELNFGAGILPAQQLEGSRNWVDGIAAVRGKAAISKKAFVTAKADLGGGGSKFTYQLFGGAGYNVTPKIALIGGYRVLDVNYAKNNFIYNMNQRGPILGVGFKF